MCGKIGQNRRVATAAGPEDDIAVARRDVGEMVCKAQARTGSRQLAYKDVGRKIGKGDAWVYRLVSGAHVALEMKTWRAIVAAYAQHAEALTQAAELSRARAAALNAETAALKAARMAEEQR